MCTVSFVSRARGYCLGMNRDEKRTRPLALAPTRLELDGCAVVAPAEPAGGTWIALNAARVTIALINWYSVAARASGDVISRGEVVTRARAASSPGAVSDALQAMALGQVNPFRLIGVFPQRQQLFEWRWDLRQLQLKSHPWSACQWISSGYDEPGAQRERAEVFRRMQAQPSAGSLAWLRRLHASHRPSRGPFSTCMHRADAVTVSYTEIVVNQRKALMRYFPGSPCEGSHPIVHGLELSR